MKIETHKTKARVRPTWRQRLRYWWWLRRLDPTTRKELDRFNREMDQRLVFGEDHDA